MPIITASAPGIPPNPVTIELTNIPACLDYWASRTPDAAAVHVLARYPASLSYRQLRNRVVTMARQMLAYGVCPGDRLAVLCNLDDRLIVTSLGAASVGAVAVPVHVTSPTARHVLQAYGGIHPYRLICLTARFGGFVRDFLHNLESNWLLRIDDPGSGLSPTTADVDNWRRRVAERSGTAAFYVNHTSGSTTTPKLVEPTDEQLLQNARACIDFFGLDGSCRMLCSFMYHCHEHFVRPLLVGGCAVMLPISPVGQSLAAACNRGRVTHLMCNPNLAEIMSRESHGDLQKLRGQLNVIEIGGGIVPAPVVRALQEGTGARTIVCYGSTETGGEALAARQDERGFKEVLYPLPGYTSRVVDDAGRDVSAGETGELILEGAAVATGYLVDPPGEVRLENHRFMTRDLAVLEAEGGVRILGRVDNAVKMLGQRQPLEPIEMALYRELGGAAECVQLLDIEAQGLARFCGLGAQLLAVFRLTREHRQLPMTRQRQLVLGAIRKAHLQAFLTVPVYAILAEDGDVSFNGVKVLRRTARERFPYELSRWPAEQRGRLIPVSASVGDLWRGVRRLAGQAGAIERPAAVLGSLAFRLLRAALPRRRGSWQWPALFKKVGRGLLALLVLYLLLLLGLVVLEDRLVYQRRARGESPPSNQQSSVFREDLWLRTSDGVQLHALWCPCPERFHRGARGERLAVIYCHGLRGDVSRRLSVVPHWQEALGADVLLFDYRGFGKSEGEPSEEGLYRDSRAAYAWLVQIQGIKPGRVIIVGRSLGGAVALELALAVEHRGLVLESTFTSLPEAAAGYVPLVPTGWLMRNRFPSLERIGTYRGRLVIAQPQQDEVIPPDHSRRLFERASEPKLLLAVPTNGHLEVAPPEFYRSVAVFFSQER